MLKQNTSLTGLYVKGISRCYPISYAPLLKIYTAGNKIGETGIKAIQEAMKTNTTLVNLGIDGFFHCFNHGDEEAFLTWFVNYRK